MMMSKNLSTAVTRSTFSELKRIYSAGLDAVCPVKLVSEALCYNRASGVLTIQGTDYKLNKNVKVVAFGKAVLGMVAAVERVIGEHIVEGVASVPMGTMITANASFPHHLPLKNSKVKIHEGAPNNLPDKAAESAAREIMSLVQNATKDELIITLISGGGSALLPCPVSGVSLEEKKQVMDRLARSGAEINELNMFRKALSGIKGGKLAQAAYPSKVVALILSDVIGDPLDIIASGPTVPNHTHCTDVVKLLNKYKLAEQLPHSIVSHLTKEEETVNHIPLLNGHYVHTQNVIIGSNRVATSAALRAARDFGYSSCVWSHSIQGEARQLGRMFASLAHDFLLRMENKIVPTSQVDLTNCPKEVQDDVQALYSSFDVIPQTNRHQVCLISGGEPTVTVRGNGRGGRNQELALAFAIKLHELRPLVPSTSSSSECLFVSVGTDGQDGPCEAAGAQVSVSMFEDVLRQGMDPLSFLEDNDSNGFFSRLSGGKYLISTGLTGTNVMDMHVMLLTV